jgi:FO synthase
VLHPHLKNIQTSWVKMGRDGAAACLQAGANDLGGTLMNESITRAAGAVHGQEMPPEAMEELIHSIGRQPRQRSTLYRGVGEDRTTASFGAAPLLPPVETRAGRFTGSLRSPRQDFSSDFRKRSDGGTQPSQ